MNEPRPVGAEVPALIDLTPWLDVVAVVLRIYADALRRPDGATH